MSSLFGFVHTKFLDNKPAVDEWQHPLKPVPKPKILNKIVFNGQLYVRVQHEQEKSKY